MDNRRQQRANIEYMYAEEYTDMIYSINMINKYIETESKAHKKWIKRKYILKNEYTNITYAECEVSD